MITVTVAPRARLQLQHIYRRSLSQFGPAARDRYELLVAAAFRDLANDPSRTGVRSAPGRKHNLRLYPLRRSRMHPPPEFRVANPRHLIVFRFAKDEVTVLAILDERMDIFARLRRL